MKKLRTKILMMTVVAILFLGYAFHHTVPYLQTFGRSYRFHGYLHTYFLSLVLSDVPTSCLTLDGNVLRYSERMNNVVSDAKVICKISLTKQNFDDLFPEDTVWTQSTNRVKMDSKWFRENCKAAWLGVSFLQGNLQLHYILKLDNDYVVVCDSSPVSLEKPEEFSLGTATYYEPFGNVFEFYKYAFEQIQKNSSKN